MRSKSLYLMIEEFAASFRVSQRTVRRWIARGPCLRARKVGGTVRVPRGAVSEEALAASRPRKGWPRRMPVLSTSALSDEAFTKTWDNAEDAVYDRWREVYGVPEG